MGLLHSYVEAVMGQNLHVLNETHTTRLFVWQSCLLEMQ